MIASAGDSTIRLWDAKTGRHLGTLQGDKSAVTAIAISPKGNLIASGSTNGVVRLWKKAGGVSRLFGGNKFTEQTAFEGHTDEIQSVAFNQDGTVVATGYSASGQSDVGGWRDIIQITAGSYHTVGLKADGTVVAVGRGDSGECDVGNWTEIIQVTAGYECTVGLKSNGSVVAVGGNVYGQCDVGDWTEIMQIAAGGYHTVGLKDDHTVVAVDWGAQLAEWDLVYTVP